MPYPGIREETGLVACLNDAIGEIDVFTKTHLGETAQLLIDITADAHIERTGIELVELGFSASDATCGEERGHRIADGLLYRCEVGMGCIGAPESDYFRGEWRVERGESIVNSLQITLR